MTKRKAAPSFPRKRESRAVRAEPAAELDSRFRGNDGKVIFLGRSDEKMDGTLYRTINAVH